MKKKLLIPVLLLAAALLCGCAFGFDAADLLEGNLDLVYHGAHNGSFRRAAGLSAKDCEAQYTESVEAETAFLADYLDIDLALCGQAASHELRNFCRNLLSHTKYEVGKAVATENGYTVEVTVYPLDDLQSFNAQDAPALLADWSARYDKGEFDAMPDEAYEALWAETLLEELTPHLETVEYLEPQTVTAEIRKGEDGLYTLTAESFAAIDALIIAY